MSPSQSVKSKVWFAQLWHDEVVARALNLFATKLVAKLVATRDDGVVRDELSRAMKLIVVRNELTSNVACAR